MPVALRLLPLAAVLVLVASPAVAFDWEACINECAAHRDIVRRDKAFRCFEGCTSSLAERVHSTAQADAAACIGKTCLPRLEGALKRCHHRHADSAYYEKELMDSCRDLAENTAHECAVECGHAAGLME
ncbi:MAG: hypothetical protein ACOCVM_02920 [Desulfovibrionaceae bacterium]